MPICEIDPWRMQYFAGVPCPADVLISTEDSDSWTWYPRHRWVYDKVAVALSQGLEAAPHGVAPRNFPIGVRTAEIMTDSRMMIPSYRPSPGAIN